VSCRVSKDRPTLHWPYRVVLERPALSLATPAPASAGNSLKPQVPARLTRPLTTHRNLPTLHPMPGPPLGRVGDGVGVALLICPAGAIWRRSGIFGFVGDKTFSAKFEPAPIAPMSETATLHTPRRVLEATANEPANSRAKIAYPGPVTAPHNRARPPRSVHVLLTYPAPGPWRRLCTVAGAMLARPSRSTDLEHPPQHQEATVVGNRGEDTAYPQRIVATRPLYRLQDRFAQLSRLQRI
jgi:hypothetical protein